VVVVEGGLERKMKKRAMSHARTWCGDLASVRTIQWREPGPINSSRQKCHPKS
jgi:hypothetical protein